MLKKSLVWKLILAFLVVAVTTAALMALFIRFTSVNRLSELLLDQQRISLQTSLTDYYIEKGSWAEIPSEWDQLRLQSIPTHAPTRTPNVDRLGARERRRFLGLADAQGVVIVPVDENYKAGSVAPAEILSVGMPILVDGKKVGTILTSQSALRFNPEENLFLERTNDALLFAVGAAMLIALLIGIFLARTLISPMQELTQAAQNIAKGQLEQQVKVTSKDEIGQLAEAFNRMSLEVARVNQLRRQMTADIAHDLRTPLTVIAGYVESMRDGVLRPTPERLALIYTEIERLQNLVGDLKMLSQVEAGEIALHLQKVMVKEMLERAVAPFQHKAEKQNVQLKVEVQEDLPELRVDEARMMQVFSNLISNALRYTPEGGKISLIGQRLGDKLVLTVRDTGVGIAEEDLPYIFERFYQVDRARSSASGESGLGLAIVNALVKAQKGEVSAQSTQGEGTAIQITFPIVR
jgi:signal transduction histidine kinase